MPLKINQLGVLLLVLNLSILCVIGYYALSMQKEKIGYVVNQRLFNEFKGKKELEDRLNLTKALNGKVTDSLSRLIQQTSNFNVIKFYQEKIDEMKFAEQQLSEQYTSDIWKNINELVTKFGEKNGYDYILGAAGNGSLMFAHKENDITSELIKFVNLKYEGD